MFGCCDANSVTARDSASLVGNAPAPSCRGSGAHPKGKLRFVSTALSARNEYPGIDDPSQFSMNPSG